MFAPACEGRKDRRGYCLLVLLFSCFGLLSPLTPVLVLMGVEVETRWMIRSFLGFPKFSALLVVPAVKKLYFVETHGVFSQDAGGGSPAFPSRNNYDEETEPLSDF